MCACVCTFSAASHIKPRTLSARRRAAPHQVNEADAVLVQGRHVAGQVAAREEAAVHAGVQRLHAACAFSHNAHCWRLSIFICTPYAAHACALPACRLSPASALLALMPVSGGLLRAHACMASPAPMLMHAAGIPQRGVGHTIQHLWKAGQLLDAADGHTSGFHGGRTAPR